VTRTAYSKAATLSPFRKSLGSVELRPGQVVRLSPHVFGPCDRPPVKLPVPGRPSAHFPLASCRIRRARRTLVRRRASRIADPDPAGCNQRRRRSSGHNSTRRAALAGHPGAAGLSRQRRIAVATTAVARGAPVVNDPPLESAPPVGDAPPVAAAPPLWLPPADAPPVAPDLPALDPPLATKPPAGLPPSLCRSCPRRFSAGAAGVLARALVDLHGGAGDEQIETAQCAVVREPIDRVALDSVSSIPQLYGIEKFRAARIKESMAPLVFTSNTELAWGPGFVRSRVGSLASQAHRVAGCRTHRPRPAAWRVGWPFPG